MSTDGKYVKPASGTCRLLLRINETDYTVKLVPCEGGAQKCYELVKRYDARNPMDKYHVSQHAHGCECTCADFVMRRNHADPAGCKHIKALVTFAMIVNITPPADAGSGSVAF